MIIKTESKYCDCPIHSVNALARILTKIADEAYAPIGLSASYANLLSSVNDRPGIQPKEICMDLQLTPSTVTRLIEKMEYKGLLTRKNVGRATEVYPTEASLALNEQLEQAKINLYEKYIGAFGKDSPLVSIINEGIKKIK